MLLKVSQIENREVWDDFLAQEKPHSFLHSWQWGEFNQRINTRIERLGVYNGDQLIAIALILFVKARRGSFLLCPHGPIISTQQEKGEVLKALTEYLRKVAEPKYTCLRISSLLPSTVENANLFKTLGYRNSPVHMVHPELAWILDVRNSSEELLRNMRKSTRYSVKKAEKEGVTVRSSNNPKDIDLFWRVYETTVTRQHFTPFSKEYLQGEFEIFSADNNAMFFFAEYQGETTAAALIVFDEQSGYYHHGATTQKYPGLTDAQLLQWQIIQEVKKRGCTYYNFWGVVPGNNKNHPWAGLSIFKRGFGGFEEKYLHAQDLILSSRYYISYLIDTARKIKRGL